MSTLNTPKQGLVIREDREDGYETGGLVYFHFEGKRMVAVIRDRSEFDKHLRLGTSLQSYADTLVSDEAYGAGLALRDLLPKKP